MNISLMMVKGEGEGEAITIEDGVIPPVSPAHQLFDDISVQVSSVPLDRPSTYYSFMTHVQQMLEISREIKESWLNFYEGNFFLKKFLFFFFHYYFLIIFLLFFIF